jgi:hypothetical protein
VQLLSQGHPLGSDPSVDPAMEARAVTSGMLDAPHLRDNSFARGQVVTRIDLR